MMTISEPSPRKALRLQGRCRPRLSSLQRCIHDATAAPIFPYTLTHRSQKRDASERQSHRHHSPDRAPHLTVARPRPNPHS
jgi:hypothetical protein